MDCDCFGSESGSENQPRTNTQGGWDPQPRTRGWPGFDRNSIHGGVNSALRQARKDPVCKARTRTLKPIAGRSAFCMGVPEQSARLEKQVSLSNRVAP